MTAALVDVAAELATLTPAAVAPDWTAALCAQSDPDAWHPGKGESVRAVKAICRRCPIQAACLGWALANDERYGVWGGTTERQRRAMKRRQGAAQGEG